MGRCPVYLNVDDFDNLANSVGLTLTDHGVSAIGEITEFLAKQLLEVAHQLSGKETLDFEDIVRSAEVLKLELLMNAHIRKIDNAWIQNERYQQSLQND